MGQSYTCQMVCEALESLEVQDVHCDVVLPVRLSAFFVYIVYVKVTKTRLVNGFTFSLFSIMRLGFVGSSSNKTDTVQCFLFMYIHIHIKHVSQATTGAS